MVEIGTQLLRVLSVSGLFIAVALTYTGGLQGTGDTKSPLYISIISQVLLPLGHLLRHPADRARSSRCTSGSRSWPATSTRCVLSVLRFSQGKWRGIAVDIGPGLPARRRSSEASDSPEER